jgi:hypothetical protein
MGTPTRSTISLGLSLASALALLAPVPAAAQPHCLPPGGTIYLCDPLDDGTSVGTATGGTFLDDGWQVDAFEDHVLYDLGTEVERGTLSFYVRGLGMETLDNGTFTGNKHHIAEFFDGSWSGDVDYGTNIRLYGSIGENPDTYGRVKFQFGSWPAAEVACPGEVYLGTWDTSQWDSGHWFHWQIEFGDGDSRCYLDGAEIASIPYDDCPAAFRYLFVPIMPDGRIDSLWGTVYSHVSFSACDDPCDDDDVCTVDDHCDGDLCTGTPAADGTPCDDGDPGTFDDACNEGACGGTPCGSACDDHNPCTYDDHVSCTTGLCAGAFVDDGEHCDDGDPETVNDLCASGVCAGDPEATGGPQDGWQAGCGCAIPTRGAGACGLLVLALVATAGSRRKTR